jgi:hypothetical protein
MNKLITENILTTVISVLSIFIVICIGFLSISCFKYYTSISEKQRNEIISIQQELPEIEPMIESVQEDGVITVQDYDYIINVSNELKRKRLLER